MTHIIVSQPDSTAIGDALVDEGADVTHVDRPITRRELERANVADATVFILTDADEATAIPLVREINPDTRIVVYTNDGITDFASHQADLVLSPAGIERTIVVETLLEIALNKSD